MFQHKYLYPFPDTASKPMLLPRTITVQAGSQLTLPCIQNDPGFPPPERYAWVKDEFITLEDTTEAKLTIEAASALDGGKYQCYSKTGTSRSPRSDPATIIVQGRIFII